MSIIAVPMSASGRTGADMIVECPMERVARREQIQNINVSGNFGFSTAERVQVRQLERLAYRVPVGTSM